MERESRPERVAPLVRVTASLGWALAALLFVLRLVLGDFALTAELPGAITLAAVAATPPTLAVLGLRRPGLLLAAGATAVLSLPVLSIFGLLELVLGSFWFIAYARSAERGSIMRSILAALVIVVLWIGASSVLFIHLDPRCAQTLADGTVRQFDGVANGFESGWVWDAGSDISGSAIAPADVVEEVCSSDVVTPLEMVISVAMIAAAIGVGWVLVEPVPRDAGLTA